MATRLDGRQAKEALGDDWQGRWWWRRRRPSPSPAAATGAGL